MSKFPFSYSLEFNCENQYNPYEFTPNSYRYFNNKFCVNNSNFEQQNFQNDDQPSNLKNNISSLLEISTQQNQMISVLLICVITQVKIFIVIKI